MAVTSVKVNGRARGAYEAERFKRTYSQPYLVQTDSMLTGAVEVLITSGLPGGLPVMYSTFQDPSGSYVDTGAFLVKLNPSQRSDNPFLWDVEAIYESEGLRPEQFVKSPFDRPTVQTATMQKFQKPAVIDQNGLAYVNSAGDPFDPPIEVDDSRPVLQLKRNEPTFDYTLPLVYKDAINADPFLGISPGSCKCQAINSVGPQFENGVLYWEVTYEFEIRLEGWNLQVLDRGYRYLNSGALTPILINGLPCTTPRLLDGAGGVLSVGGTPKYRTFTPYPSLPFAPLNLP
jgi:hypothetical protein